MAAFRKMTGVHSNDSLQYNSESSEYSVNTDSHFSVMQFKFCPENWGLGHLSSWLEIHAGWGAP